MGAIFHRGVRYGGGSEGALIQKATETVSSGSSTHQLSLSTSQGVIVAITALYHNAPTSVARCIPFANNSGKWFFSAVSYQLQPITDSLDVTYYYVEGDFS